VPIAGKYRLVDFPISNCINSGINCIYVLTQFNSASLNQHIHNSYRFDAFSGGFVEILAAQQTTRSTAWYQGTADAVRQNFVHLIRDEYDYVLILSGDQLYRMDYGRVLKQHINLGADITICALPVPRPRASSLGVLQVNSEKQIARFVEKPQEPKVLDSLRLQPTLQAELRLPRDDDYLLANMGIYVFNREVLRSALDNDKTDFGKHIIPDSIKQYRVFAYLFQGYWEDVGTIGSFFDANLALCSSQPSFDLFNRETPLYTHARFLPPSKVSEGHAREALIADGCEIHNARIEHCIIGVRSIISEDCELRDTIAMGADYYETETQKLAADNRGIPRIGVGRGSKIQRAILDKNARIGDGVVITDKSGAPDSDAPNYHIRNGIVVVPKNAVIPSGTTI
jgi:glucose-1-phosphate adenylyltransferase